MLSKKISKSTQDELIDKRNIKKLQSLQKKEAAVLAKEQEEQEEVAELPI